mgnify:CR=1 FL=1
MKLIVKRIIGVCRMKIERRSRWDGKWWPVNQFLMWVEDYYWRVKGYEIIECIGDSHVAVFRRLNWEYPQLRVRYRTVSVLGATAYGLAKSSSKTKAKEKYETHLARKNVGNHILIMLGEVDCSYLVWALSEKKAVSADLILQKSLKAYCDYLSALESSGLKIIVCSAPIPTVEDGIKNPEYISIRDNITATQIEKTNLTLSFNRSVKHFCEKSMIRFLDFDEDAINPSTGLVSEAFKNIGCVDHHYNEKHFSSVIYKKMVDEGQLTSYLL